MQNFISHKVFENEAETFSKLNVKSIKTIEWNPEKYLTIVIAILLISFQLQGQNPITPTNNFKKSNYGFIENKGQIHDQNYLPNPSVKYLLSLGNGLNVQLKANSFSYDTYIIERTKKEKKENEELEMPRHPFDSIDDYDITYKFHRVDIELVNSNPNPEIIAEGASEDYLNYYNAVTPEEGATFVRSYQKVTYKDIYPGIDLEFQAKPGTEKPVEYNFIVHPGADASKIRIKYNGANETVLLDGKISVKVAHGTFYESIPLSHLKETVEKVDVSYLKFDENEFGFQMPKYDERQVLVIDPVPVLVWGTYYGVRGTDAGYDIKIDKNRDIIVIGYTSAAIAMATSGAHQVTFGGDFDAFIAKFNISGQRIWGTYYGGTGGEFGYSIVPDSSRQIFVTGFTKSSTAIATTGAYQSSFGGWQDAFIVKFNSSGQRLWGTYYGGSKGESGYGISTDIYGNVFVTGETASTSSIATSGAFQTSFGGIIDAFIVKFNSSGQRQWGTYYGGKEEDKGESIATDSTGNIIFTGTTSSTSNISSSGSHQSSYGGGRTEAFIAKFNSSGQRQWGSYYGGTKDEEGYSVFIGINENIIMSGSTSSDSSIATSGVYQTSLYGGLYVDAFIVKFKPSGQRIWATYFGGNFTEYGYSITSDSNENVFVVGNTQSTGGLATKDAHQTTDGGNTNHYPDGFIAKFNKNGSLKWGTYYGGNKGDQLNAICIEENGNIYVTGGTSSSNAISTKGAYQDTFGGSQDAIIARFFDCQYSYDTISVNACDSFKFNGLFLKDSGTYYNTLKNFNGCDSFITLYLFILPNPKSQFSIIDSAQCLFGNLFSFTNNSTSDSGIINYIWMFGDNDSSFIKTPTHSYNQDDTFIIKLIAISANGCHDSSFNTAIVYPIPYSKFSIYDSLQCLEGNAFGFTNKSTINSGTMTYIWDFGDHDSSTQDNPIHTYGNADTFDIRLIATSAFGCKDTSGGLTYVVAYPEPLAAFSIKDTAICFRDNLFEFLNTSTIKYGSFTSFWDFGDGDTLVQKDATHQYKNDDTLSVKLLLISDHNCKDSVIQTVYIWPMPISDFAITDNSQCLYDNQFEFYDTSTIKWGNLSTEWHFGDDSLSFDGLAFHSYLYHDTFNVNLISISDFNCRDTSSQLVFVHPMPKAAFFVNDSDQCLRGNSFQFTDSTYLPYGTMNYFWEFGDGDTSVLQSPIHSYPDFDAYMVRMKVMTANGCSDSTLSMVYTYSMPVADFKIKDDKQCLRDNLFEFSNNSTIPFSTPTYKWIFGDGNQDTSTSPNHQYLSDDTFYIKLIAASNLGCLDSLNQQVVVFPMPKALFDINDSSQCLTGNLFNFDNQSVISPGGLTYRWFFGDGDSIQIKNPNHNYKTFDTFNVQLISTSSFLCRDSFNREVYVHPMPKADFSVNDSDQCFNEQIFDFTNNSTIFKGSLNFVWTLDNLSLTSKDLVNFRFSAFGNKIVKLLAVSDQNCADSIEKQVIVYASPVPDFSINDSTQCFDSNNFVFTNFSAIGSGLMTYNWTIDSFNFSTLNIPTFNFSDWGEYPIKLKATSDKACSDSVSKVVWVFPMPVAAYIYLHNCLLDTMWFFDKSATDSGIVNKWRWHFEDTNYSNLQNPTYIFSKSGQKGVTLKATTNFGCSTDITRWFIIENQVNAPELERATVENDEFVLIEWNAPTEGIPMTYHLEKSTDSIIWNLISDFDNKTFNYNDLQTYVDLRNYYYRINVTDSCQFTSPYSNIGKTILLSIDTTEQFPVLIWTPYELWTSGVAGYELQVTGCELQVSGSNDFQTVIEIPQSAIINPQSAIIQSDTLTKLSSPTYCYRVIATRNGDGLQSLSNVVCTPTPFRLFIPNAFTPNNDGLNDEFLPQGIHILNYNLQIFSRWGEKIFESNDINQGWDGTYKGRVCQVDEYFFQISANGTGSQRKTVVGTVMLLR